jgi:putative ABC transport system ATP-binding protein
MKTMITHSQRQTRTTVALIATLTLMLLVSVLVLMSTWQCTPSSSKIPDMPLVASVKGLSKIYRKPGTNVEVPALRNIDLDLVQGEFTAIMGASGSGKSTLMNILGCLDQATSGSYMLGDVDVSTLDDNQLSEIRSERIGFIFQNFNLIQQLTVLENLEVPMFYLGIPPAERRRRAIQLAERVGLADRVHHRPMELSGGQQQRVCVARSMVNEPLILLADEPTGALDSKTGAQILELFDELVAAGKTIILVTHDPGVAHRCDRVVTLHDGRVSRDERQPRRRSELQAAHQPATAT